VDGGDVRVRGGGRGPRLAQEAAASLGVAEQVLWEDLERDGAPEHLVLGGVDDAHGAPTEPREHVVAAERASAEVAERGGRGGGRLRDRAEEVAGDRGLRLLRARRAQRGAAPRGGLSG